MSAVKTYWIYILQCEDGRYYTGYTSDLRRRFRQHRNPKGGAKFTRSFKPTSLAGCWRLEGSRGTAMRVENWIKKQKRSVKIELITNPALLKALLQGQMGPEFDLVFDDNCESVFSESKRQG
jgi:putative endonuclease